MLYTAVTPNICERLSHDRKTFLGSVHVPPQHFTPTRDRQYVDTNLAVSGLLRVRWKGGNKGRAEL